ncbi:HpcH/HpaI aldolase/citrate lyase family protein [Streptomyces abyssalis]|uniref:HpcH/HpaI aldolase/citrate lyase family protein n=1 Tax=Streptomyces abyssalis TaxID=933944 RepID=UPI00085BF945|nr:CoA ester lyase [Streptomyces abyssalis]
MDVGRTLLFVPGDRPDRIRKALASGADSVAVDFEDAVGEGSKDAARTLTAEALTGLVPLESGGAGGPGEAVPPPRAGRPGVHIRVNALETPEAEADLAAVSSLIGKVRLDGLIVPKARSAAQLTALEEMLTAAEAAAGVPHGLLSLLPVVESAAGVLEAGAVAAAGLRVRMLVFGTLDLAAELGVHPTADGRELLHARSQVVLAARAAGLPGPLDGPHAALDDEEGLLRSSRAARELGFTGRVVLHPRQVRPVREAFAPTERELGRAREVLAAYKEAAGRGLGAVRLSDGTFIDRPVVTRAEALLREAGTDVAGTDSADRASAGTDAAGPDSDEAEAAR